MTRAQIEAVIQAHQAALDLMAEPRDGLSLAQLVFRDYLELESLAAVAQRLRNEGRRLPSGQAIQVNTISSILQTSPAEVSLGVRRLVQYMFDRRRRGGIGKWI